jgi:very-short-patch-repair endonuclease
MVARRLTTEDFEKKSIEKHGDKYDYKESKYEGSKKKIKIYCNTHKEYFYQIPMSHMRGRGCIKCGIESGKKKRLENNYAKETLENVREKGNKIHIDDDGKYLYKYIELLLIGKKSYIKLKCLRCTIIFQQRVDTHIDDKCGCSKCGGSRRKTKEEFELEGKTTHKDENNNPLYGYDKVVYVNNVTPVILLCITCNREFEQKPINHICHKHGCIYCGMSKTERLGRAIVEKLMGCEFPKTFPSFLRTDKYISGLELDAYNKQLKLAFEFDGRQHDGFTPFFHDSKADFDYQQEKDSDKDQLCKDNGITLIRVPYQYNSMDIDKMQDFIFKKLEEHDYLFIYEPPI